MRMKKIGLLGLALVLALALTGAAFAHWSDTVKIEGTVQMGDFLVGWEEIIACSDNEDMNLPIKDVGNVTCELSDPEDSVHHPTPVTVYHTLSVNVTNAYPQYNATCEVNIKNAGTIPAHIVSVNVTPGAGLFVGTVSYDVSNNPVDWCLVDDEGKAVLDVVVCKQDTLLSLVCNQLEPCSAEAVDVTVEVKQDGAQECHTYTFDIEFEAWQWNKA